MRWRNRARDRATGPSSSKVPYHKQLGNINLIGFLPLLVPLNFEIIRVADPYHFNADPDPASL